MTPARALGLGLLLTATAGMIDAVGFIALGGYYTSFMSGNTTQLGTALAERHFGALALPAGLVALFFIGSYLGALMAHGDRFGPARALGLVVVAIGVALRLDAAGFGPTQSMLALACAAGAQNAALQPIGAARLGTTFVTGTLYAAGQDLARATYGAAPPWRWAQHLMVWGALCGGALLGAFAFAAWGMHALVLPAAVYLGCLIWLAMRPNGRE